MKQKNRDGQQTIPVLSLLKDFIPEKPIVQASS
jgi:hypothetical protein